MSGENNTEQFTYLKCFNAILRILNMPMPVSRAIPMRKNKGQYRTGIACTGAPDNLHYHTAWERKKLKRRRHIA